MQNFIMSKPHHSGTLKNGYLSKDSKRILLVPKSKKGKQQIIHQFTMMNYMKQIKLPTISQVSLVQVNEKMGLIQQYIPHSLLVKPHDSESRRKMIQSICKLPLSIRQFYQKCFEKTIKILDQYHLLIEDLQFLYSLDPPSLKIIDPFEILCLDSSKLSWMNIVTGDISKRRYMIFQRRFLEQQTNLQSMVDSLSTCP